MNPELRRNLWLEFTLHRLLAMPAVAAITAALIVAASEADPLGNVAQTAAYGFAALVLLWGTQLAAASVIDEARARTWDAQRMSAIGPWAMTWGKLVGAPSFAWYGGAILLVMFVLAGWAHLEFPVLRSAMIMVAGAVLLHAMALNAGVIAARKGATKRNTAGLVLMLIALLSFGPAAGLVTALDQHMDWWRFRIPAIDFFLVTVSAYAAWAVLGAYRSMCNELEIRTMPWAFLAFVAFTAVYLAGFFVRGYEDDLKGLNAILLSGMAVSLTATYLLLFTEQAGPSVWQRLQSRVRAKQWRRALEELPVWSVALAAGLVLAVGATLFRQASATVALLQHVELAPLAIALFAVRDAALFQFFVFARQARRPEAATLFYLALLYWLVPGLLSAVGATSLAELILPPLITRPAFATAVVGVQAAITVALALWRWRRNHALEGRVSSVE